jgi:prepilin-type processing-associated H-X9-DG protein
MKLKLRSPQRGDVSLIDLLAIIAAVAIVCLVGYVQFLDPAGPKAQQINCVNNLKSIGLSYRMWGQDNGDRYPAQISTNAGGTMELAATGLPFPDFVVMSNEICTPRILVCPQDKQRQPGINFGTLHNLNISYFNSPDADESNPLLWLSGDRNLATNNTALKPGMFTMSTNRVLSWTAQIHSHQGNLAFADASVQQLNDARLRQSATNMLSAWFAVTNASFRLLIP